MGDQDDKNIEKQWKEIRKQTGGDEGENRRRSSQSFFTAVLKLSKQKDQDAILQLKTLKSSLRHSSAEQATPTLIHLTDEEKRLEKQIENMMELESVSLTDGESVDDDKCDVCGYRSTEALADCCFRVGFIQLAMGVLSGCAHIFLSFAADDDFGIIDDSETNEIHPLAITGNVVEAVAYGMVSLAGLSIICSVCLRKKWLAALHFGICLASPFLFLSVVTIVSQYGTTFTFAKTWLNPLWIAIHSFQVIMQFMFSSFSWRLLTSMDAIISDDMDEDQIIFDAIERDEDAFRKRMPKI